MPGTCPGLLLSSRGKWDPRWSNGSAAAEREAGEPRVQSGLCSARCVLAAFPTFSLLFWFSCFWAVPLTQVSGRCLLRTPLLAPIKHRSDLLVLALLLATSKLGCAPGCLSKMPLLNGLQQALYKLNTSRKELSSSPHPHSQPLPLHFPTNSNTIFSPSSTSSLRTSPGQSLAYLREHRDHLETSANTIPGTTLGIPIGWGWVGWMLCISNRLPGGAPVVCTSSSTGLDLGLSQSLDPLAHYYC